MKFSNRVCIKSSKSVYAHNSVLHTIFEEIKNGNDYCAYVAVGSSNAPSHSGQQRLVNYLTHKKARIESSNFDPTYGECYVEVQIELDNFELGGQMIGEVGLTAHDESNPIVVNRAVFENPVKKDSDQLVITVFFFLSFEQGETVLHKGENALIRALFCRGSRLSDISFTVLQASAETALPCQFSYTENGFRLSCQVVASEDYQFILYADGLEVMKFIPKEQFLRTNTVAMTAVGGEIKPPSRYTLDIFKVERNGVEVDLTSANKLFLPSGLDTLDFRFDVRLLPDCRIVKSVFENFVMLIYEDDIVVMDLREQGKIKLCNTFELELNKDYSISDYGDIFCLGADRRSIVAYRLINGVYRKKLCEPTFVADMDLLAVSLNLNGRISLCAGGIDVRQIVFYDIGFEGDRYVLLQSRSLSSISNIKKLHPIADGCFFVEYTSIALASVSGNISFSASSIGYTSGHSFSASGYILSIINNTSGLLQSYYYNRRKLVRLQDIAPENAIISSYIWGQIRDEDVLLQFYYCGTEESATLTIDSVVPNGKVFSAKGYIFTLTESGAVKVWSLGCEYFLIRSSLFSDGDYDITYEYKHPMPFLPQTVYTAQMDFDII